MAKSSGWTRRISPTRSARSESEVLNSITFDGWNEYLGSAPQGRTMQGYIASLRGFDGKPTLVSQSEFDKLTSDPSNIVMYRGFRRDEEANISQFKNGDMFYNGTGGYGQGAYFATQPLSTFSASGKFISAILDTRKAKIGDYNKLFSQYQKERMEHRAKVEADLRDWKMDTRTANNTVRVNAYDDFGSWATAKGYDAYVTPESGFKEYVVLNRSKLKVLR